MVLDADRLINIFKNFSHNNTSEIFEDDAAVTSTPQTVAPSSAPSSGGASSGGTGKQVRVWSSKRKMGPTYQGPGYVWTSGRSLGPTYQGPGYKWSSGRNMSGPTGGSDFA